MRMLVLSDIHGRTLERAECIADDYDLTLIAGDITHFGGYCEAMDILESFVEGRDVFAIYGNCDNKDVERYLREKGISVHNEVKEFGGYKITGFSGAPVSQFNTPGEFDDTEIGRGLLDWGEGDAIVITHVPAFCTKLDLSLRAGHIGSESVRKFIEEKQPMLHVCGHVHESRGIDRIGRTVSLNPGPYFQGCYADVELGSGVVCTLREF